MSTAVVEIPLIRPTSRLTHDQLSDLARTYDRAAQPIWIHDLHAQCLYRNRRAARTSPRARAVQVFDITDPDGQIIARLTAAAC